MQNNCKALKKNNLNIDQATITSKIYKLSIFLVFFIWLNGDFRQMDMLFFGSLGFFVVCNLFATKAVIRFNSFSVWKIVFVLFCIIASTWTISKKTAINLYILLIENAVLILFLTSSVCTIDDIKEIIKLVLLAWVVNTLYLIITNMDRILQQGEEEGLRIAENSLVWNANDIGMRSAFSVMFLVYLMQGKGKIIKKIGLLLIIVAMCFMILISGSRKAIVILVAGVALFFFIKSKGQRLRIVFLSVIALALVSYLIFEVPYFYDIIGWRIESLIAGMMGRGELDGSAKSRKLLIEGAIDAWRKKPIFGWGLDSFWIFGEKLTGRKFYAHNNYLELMSCMGLVGLLTYYYIYIHSIVLLVKYRHEHNLASLLIAIMMVILVLEYACVTFSSLYWDFLIMCIFSYGNICRRRDVSTQHLKVYTFTN